MAKKQQTIEEKLQAALVPVEEQPYKVPENWCWCNLKSFSEIRTGKKDANYGTENGKYLFFTCASEPIRCDGYSFEGKSILLAGNGDIGNISLYDGKFEAYQRTYVLSIVESLSTEYVYYYFKYKWVDYNNDKMYGSAIPYIRLGNLKEFPVPIPPITEQNRIVSIVESLFAKLDEAKDKIQEVLDGADLRRAAILHQAFTGKLTEKWRRENGVSDGSWDKVPLGNVIELLSGQDFKPTDYNDAKNGIPYITGASNFDDGVIINRWTEKPTVIAKRDDILLVCKGSGYGKTIIADFEQAHIARQIMALRVKEGIINKYVLYFLMDKYDEIRNSGQGLIPGISRKVVLGMNIFKISMPEQQEIVRLLDNLLSREQSTVTACEEALTTIDTLKKSILARAFRGELGTNDPSEASAKELLQEILAS